MARGINSGNSLTKEERQARFIEGVRLGLSDSESLKFKAQLINVRSLERWRREDPDFKARHEKAKEMGRAYRESNPVQYAVTLDSVINTSLAYLQEVINSDTATVNEKLIATRVILDYEPKAKTVNMNERVVNLKLGEIKNAEPADEAAAIEVDFS